MDSKALDARIRRTERQLEELRTRYDQWLTGLERCEPGRDLAAFEQELKLLQTYAGGSTATRFRLDQLTRRYLSYQQYWRRAGRQMEAGTWPRDQKRVERRRKAREESAASPTAHANAEPQAAAPEVPGQRLQEMYERFIAARIKNREPVHNVRLETIQRTVEQALPKLLRKYPGREIDFAVVVRNGKVALKPVVK